MSIDSQALFPIKNYIFFESEGTRKPFTVRCTQPNFFVPSGLSLQQKLALSMMMDTTLGVSTLAFKCAGIKCPHKVIQALRAKGLVIKRMIGTVVNVDGRASTGMNIYFYHAPGDEKAFYIYAVNGGTTIVRY